MGGIDLAVITHKLNVSPSFKPVKQKRRSFALERQKTINEEVSKLLQARDIREINYPDWLANVVLVKKKNGKWRLCIDFTNVNRACPKDNFPLPWIDLIVDTTSGQELLSFIEAFPCYNQIRMDPSDQEKTSFVTEQGTYCYKVMPFGLKNVGSTYQRLVNKMFQKHIGTSMEVQTLPRACQDLPSPSRATNLDLKPLAFSAVGIRHTWAPAHWKGSMQIRYYWSGLLH